MSQISTEQLQQLSSMLQPVIAKYLEEPVVDTTVSITCTPINEDDPDGASIMSFDVKVRGHGISPEQEEMIATSSVQQEGQRRR